jgi:hypothetical protein
MKADTVQDSSDFWQVASIVHLDRRTSQICMANRTVCRKGPQNEVKNVTEASNLRCFYKETKKKNNDSETNLYANNAYNPGAFRFYFDLERGTGNMPLKMKCVLFWQFYAHGLNLKATLYSYLRKFYLAVSVFASVISRTNFSQFANLCISQIMTARTHIRALLSSSKYIPSYHASTKSSRICIYWVGILQ